MGMRFTNNARSRLTQAVAPTHTAIHIATADVSKFPALANGDYCHLTIVGDDGKYEIIKATAISSAGVITAVRAQEDTTAQSWAINDRVELRLTSAFFDTAATKDDITTSIEVGTVTTAAQNAQAAVVNSGTSSNAIFDFTLPRGDKGDTGASVTDAEINAEGELILTLTDRQYQEEFDTVDEKIEEVREELNTKIDTYKEQNQLWLEESGQVVSFYPVSGSPLDVTVNILPVEVPPASGEKSPENPSTIQGLDVVKVTRCGKNLIPFGTVEKPDTIQVIKKQLSCDLPSAQYVFSMSDYTTTSADNAWLVVAYYRTTYVLSFSDYVHTLHDSEKIPRKCDAFWFYSGKSGLASIGTAATYSNVQLELGSTNTPYEPYEGQTYTIDLPETVYGGTLDLSKCVLIKEWENISDFSSLSMYWNGKKAVQLENGRSMVTFAFKNLPFVPYDRGSMCSHFVYVPSLGDGTGVLEGFVSNVVGTENWIQLCADNARLGLTDVDVNTPDSVFVEAWKKWLVAEGVTIICKLNFPIETPIENIPQLYSLIQQDKYIPRLNCVFSNASSVEVGYAKSPIKEHQDTINAIISTGEINV